MTTLRSTRRGTSNNNPTYLIWTDQTGGAHISRSDARVDTLTGNSLTVEQAVTKLSQAKVDYKLIEDLITGRERPE